ADARASRRVRQGGRGGELRAAVFARHARRLQAKVGHARRRQGLRRRSAVREQLLQEVGERGVRRVQRAGGGGCGLRRQRRLRLQARLRDGVVRGAGGGRRQLRRRPSVRDAERVQCVIVRGAG